MAITGTISGVGNSVEVSYSGDIQSYTIPLTGTYKLEVWGGAGGTSEATNGFGGYGGYAYGEIVLTQGQVLYIGVGGAGVNTTNGTSTNSTLAGGYNGGGDGYNCSIWTNGTIQYRASGGGATHIALGTNRGVLTNYESYKSEILIVAGGGGGGVSSNVSGSWRHYYGGRGGGYTGAPGQNNVIGHQSYGTQTSGGFYSTNSIKGGFGFGTNGGGSGWYGAMAIEYGAGSGGSGYIGGVKKSSTRFSTNSGNGKSVITYISPSTTIIDETKVFNFTGDIQSYTVPQTGTYRLEAWGAQGGNYDSNIGGFGGYSCGEITLTKGQILYIGCGGSGATIPANTGDVDGGYNGGGGTAGTTFKSYQRATGGGATHIALGTNRGVLTNYESYKSEILIVAGGGGGASKGDIKDLTEDGAGGGSSGRAGMRCGGRAGATGGTQTAGGSKGQYENNADSDGSFGKGGNVYVSNAGAGGGGWYGGGAGSDTNGGGGGSGYITPLEEAFTENGLCNSDGYVYITLITKSGPTIYIGTQEVSAIYIGTTDITEAFIGLNAVS